MTSPADSLPGADAPDWERAIAGDGESFGRIFDRHRDRLYRHSLRLAASPSDADDVVAMAFFEAWRKRASVRIVDGSVLPWLLVTATNVARNQRRSAARYRALLDRLPPRAHDDRDPAEEHEVVSHLRALPAVDREILALCVVEGYSEREAAEALGVAPGTVKSRLHRARRRLAARLAV